MIRFCCCGPDCWHERSVVSALLRWRKARIERAEQSAAGEFRAPPPPPHVSDPSHRCAASSRPYRGSPAQSTQHERPLATSWRYFTVRRDLVVSRWPAAGSIADGGGERCHISNAAGTTGTACGQPVAAVRVGSSPARGPCAGAQWSRPCRRQYSPFGVSDRRCSTTGRTTASSRGRESCR